MNEKSPFRVGLVGYGWAATAHIAAIERTRGGKVVAVCSSRDLDETELSAAHGTRIRTTNTLEDLLKDDEVDVISITSYPSQHREQAVAAAEAGKHLIIEKPMALSLEDCRSILEAVEANGVQAAVCFEVRFSAQFVTTRSLIDSGMLGEIHYGEIDYFHGIGPWYGQYRWNIRKEHGGSSFLSAGCHALDALLLCMGGEVESVTSLSTRSKSDVFQAYEYDTSAVALLRFTDGRVAKCASIIDCLQPDYFHTHLVGSEGSLLDDKFHTRKLGGLRKDDWSRLNVPLMNSRDGIDHPYEDQFEKFFEALSRGENGEPMPLTSIQEAFRTHEIAFAADLSASEGGRVVHLDELR